MGEEGCAQGEWKWEGWRNCGGKGKEKEKKRKGKKKGKIKGKRICPYVCSLQCLALSLDPQRLDCETSEGDMYM